MKQTFQIGRAPGMPSLGLFFDRKMFGWCLWWSLQKFGLRPIPECCEATAAPEVIEDE